MAVNRCLCRKIPFAQALETAREAGCGNVAELQRYLPLGTGCGLCIPYMQRALATGETDLPVLGEAESNRWLAVSGLMPEDKR